VKDIFRVDGFETRCGSELPPELFAGAEAKCVTTLRKAGALILGKTVTTEFAYLEPGPTRNPRNLEHTPGGSSSGSAAAVAAGFCQLALGTQTVGSTIRPAAFCGVVGFKPSFGRISMEGIIPFSVSVDHVGLFTQDVKGMALAAAVLCREWQTGRGAEAAPTLSRPALGVPGGPYLAQASPEGLTALESQIARLQHAGYTVKRLAALPDIAEIKRRHMRMIAAELAEVHKEWFAKYEALYRPRTAALIREGQSVGPQELAAGIASRQTVRAQLERLMSDHGIDLWLCPPATGPAPRGLECTGDPAMNLPWTHTGLPALTVPAGRAAKGLPLGLQLVGRFGEDERLLRWAERLETIFAEAND
jgi:Asp-tRNA(Asn)/Glu-tRNA(Gln) amidotransferase A subunit family amidase